MTTSLHAASQAGRDRRRLEQRRRVREELLAVLVLGLALLVTLLLLGLQWLDGGTSSSSAAPAFHPNPWRSNMTLSAGRRP